MTVVAEIDGIKELWEETTGDSRIVVAILDGPVDRTHPCFVGAKIDTLETLVRGRATDGSASQHGTHVASLILGQHGGALAGIAPTCTGLIVPVFEEGSSREIIPCSQLDMARAIIQAVQRGARIINISAGQLSPGGAAHPLLADAVHACSSSNVLIVSSAGNDGCDCLHVPGALQSVLAVGAMSEEGAPLGFSNWGANYQSHGVLALGENIDGAMPAGGIRAETGTSYATAIVSGVAALLMSLQRKRGNQPDAAAVRDAILRSAAGCSGEPIAFCRRLLAGRMNVGRARAIIAPEEIPMPCDTVPPAAANVPLSELSDAKKLTGQLVPASAEGSSHSCSCVESGSTNKRISQGTPDVGTPACGCASAGPVQLVYALGRLGYDFGTEARRDSIQQHMERAASPYDPSQLLRYLAKNPWDAEAIIWTLSLDATPIYAIEPGKSFAGQAYERLTQFLGEQSTEGVERVSIPGVIVGKARLSTGQVVPTVRPELRGMCSWTTNALVQAVAGPIPAQGADKKDQDAYAQKVQPIRNFLERVYFEFRNLGLMPQDRARNAAATNAIGAATIFESAIRAEMELDSVEVERSPICRPDADCWDVKLLFFDPKRQFERARKVYRFAIDVSDTCPVAIDGIREWSVR